MTAAKTRRPRYIPTVVTVDMLAGHSLRFETEPCGRCGGTGHFSWNALTGSRCFDCNGTKTRLTRSGKAARQRFEDALAEGAVPARELTAGDIVRDDRRWRRVVEIEVRDVTDGTPMGYWERSNESMMAAGPDADTRLWMHIADGPEGHVYRGPNTQAVIKFGKSNLIVSGHARYVRHTPELMAAAWTAALAKRGAEIAEKESA